MKQRITIAATAPRGSCDAFCVRIANFSGVAKMCEISWKNDKYFLHLQLFKAMWSGGIELHRALGYKLTYIGWHSSSALVAHRQPHIVGQRAAPPPRGSTRKGVIFNYLSLSNLAVWFSTKMIDNSTYIVGISRSAVIGRLYTFHGVGLLFYPSHR